MLLAESVQLMPDKTFFVQLGIFLAVLFALNHFVFKPVLRIIALRREKTKGAQAQIEALAAKTETLVKEYEAKIQEARKEAFGLKEGIRREGEAQGQKMVQEARQASLVQVEQMRHEIKRETDQAGRRLETEAERIGKTLAEKLLGRPI